MVPTGVSVLVVGDVCIDWLAADWRQPPTKVVPPSQSWRSQTQVQMLAMMSGAWLLENFLLRLGPDASNHHMYLSYKRPPPGTVDPSTGEPYPNNRRTANPNDYLHTFTELSLCERVDPESGGGPTRADGRRVYRVRDEGRLKYWGPGGRREPNAKPIGLLARRAGDAAPKAGPPPAAGFDPAGVAEKCLAAWDRPRLVVVADGGYGFHDDPNRWDKFLPEPGRAGGPADVTNTHVVLFQKGLLPGQGGKTNPLWERIKGHYADRTVVVTSAEHLRHAGVSISKSLSWERTGEDFRDRMANNPVLQELARARHVVVRFGTTGAVHTWRPVGGDPAREYRLYYDPRYGEGELRRLHGGTMRGLTAVLAATVARAVADGLAADPAPGDLSGCVGEGTHAGLLNARRLFGRGFGRSPKRVLKLESADRWNDEFPAYTRADLDGSPFAEAAIPPEGPRPWRILDLDAREADELAKQIVRRGLERTLAARTLPFPAVRFGDHWVVDRQEIESFRAIRNLLRDHDRALRGPGHKRHRPLSVAVFGPPGSGKSFGVKAIARSLFEKEDGVTFVTCNLAELSHPDELSKALLPIRDIALDGRLPVVFFDEFDSTLPGPGGELGWLKRFLPVMQDGEFKHGERAMKVGGPVFVFAGGTCKNYQEFCRVGADDDRRKAFVAVKGPDFVSRLRGHVDIRGADRAAGENQEFMIRRAVFIRSNMWKEHRPCFSSPDDERGADLRIDDAVLDALLRVGTYKHGARSLEAVIAMSRLAEAGQFDAAMLPSADQLNMHVDGVEFLDLVKDYPGRPPTRGRR